MTVSFSPALAHTLGDVADVMTRGFARYFVDIKFTPAAIANMVRQDSVDLAFSPMVLRDDELVGGAFVARRGWSSRVAAMGIIPEARGTGMGRRLMERVISDAKERGDRTVWLEVIADNTPAIRLYESLGFQTRRRLVGYSADAPGATSTDRPEVIDVREVARVLSCHALSDLPWQISGETLAQMGPPLRGYRLGSAYVVISDPEATNVSVRGIAVEPKKRSVGWVTRLLRALMARYPDVTWHVPPYFPEETIAGIFEPLGFIRTDLSQFQMVWSVDDV